MTRDLPDVPGTGGLIETVVLAPGEVVPAHRHDADVFAYVLEGSVITQLKGGTPRAVHAGGVSYESPTDVHIASRNASTTRPVDSDPQIVFLESVGGNLAASFSPELVDRPFVFTSLRSGAGLKEVVAWIRRDVLCEPPIPA